MADGIFDSIVRGFSSLFSIFDSVPPEAPAQKSSQQLQHEMRIFTRNLHKKNAKIKGVPIGQILTENGIDFHMEKQVLYRNEATESLESLITLYILSKQSGKDIIKSLIEEYLRLKYCSESLIDSAALCSVLDNFCANSIAQPIPLEHAKDIADISNTIVIECIHDNAEFVLENKISRIIFNGSMPQGLINDNIIRAFLLKEIVFESDDAISSESLRKIYELSTIRGRVHLSCVDGLADLLSDMLSLSISPSTSSPSSSAHVVVDDRSAPPLLQLSATPSSSSRRLPHYLTDVVKNQLFDIINPYRDYACSDARRFAHCVREEVKTEVFDRYINLPEHLKCVEAKANLSAAGPMGGQYTPYSIRRIASDIDRCKSGCCTTLAISAANKIMKEQPSYRVEIVTTNMHCFVLVNRETGNLLDPKTWGPQTYICDPWYASLGWNGVSALSEYPHPETLVDLQGKFDSDTLNNKHDSVASSGFYLRNRG